jgi:hypothetical protein
LTEFSIYIYQNKITEWQKTGRLEPKNSKKPKRLIEAEIPVDNETNHDEETIIGIYRGCSLGSLTKINVDWTKRTPIGDMIQGICLRQDAEQHQDLQKLKPGLVVDGLPEARTLALEHFIHRALCQHSTDNNLKRPTNLSSLFNSALSPPVVRYIQNIEWMKQYVSAEKIDTIVARMLETMKLHRTVELAGCQAKARVHLSIIREIREEIWELLVSIFHPDRKISTLQFKWAQELIRQLDTTYYYEFHGRRSRNVLQMVWKALEDQLQVSPMVYEEIQAVCLRSCVSIIVRQPPRHEYCIGE